MNYKPILFFAAFVVLAWPSFALSPRGEFTFPWGKAAGELGVFQEEDYRRGPLHFAVDDRGFVYVADAYKARIAVFDAQGKFERAIELEDVSPRMTFFSRHGDGTFVLCNDQRVQRVTDKGVSLGGFGLGLTLPDRFWATTTQTFIVGKADQGTISLVFNSDFTQQSTFALQSPKGSIASVKDEKGRIWLPVWADQSKTFSWKAELPVQATLMASDGEGRSVWSWADEASRKFWKLDASGKVLETASLVAPALPVASVVYAADAKLNLYQSHWNDRGFVVVKFVWSK